MTYIYRGDKHTDPLLKMLTFEAVRRANGKCIRSGSNLLVLGSDGKRYVVLGRQLRKIKPALQIVQSDLK